MNATVAASGFASQRLRGQTARACFHCGEPIPLRFKQTVRVFERDEPMCCVGCAAVARAIIDSGLGDYYRQRSELSPSGSPATAQRAPVDAQAFDLPGVRAQYVSTSVTSDASASLYLDGITCSACLWLAESTLARLPGITAITVNYSTHQADVSWAPAQQRLSAIVSAIERVGLRATPIHSAAAARMDVASERRALVRLGVALLGMMQVMMFTLPRYFDAPDDISIEAAKLMDGASLILTLPVVLFSASDIFRGAWHGLMARTLSMDVPVALAIAATFVTSTIAMMRGDGVVNAVYFDSITMFVFLLLAARYWQLRARNQVRATISRLANALPSVAEKMSAYPRTRAVEQVASAALCAGDMVLVSSGATVPADGDIIEGESAVDEAVLSGEARPVAKWVGMRLMGGTVNGASPLVMRVTAAGSASTIAAIERLARRAMDARSALAIWSDRHARYIAPLTLGIAIASGAVWWFIDSSKSLAVTIAVLAVTCPCALALAAPTAFAVATRRLVERGLLISRAHVLDKLPTITDVVFDKTGTLTTGELSIVRIDTAIDMSPARVLALAAALEIGAVHPIARALARVAGRGEAGLVADNIRVFGGQGVQGEIGGVVYRFGHAAFACDANVATHPDDAFVLSAQGKYLATFCVDDPPREDAAATVHALQRAGLTVHILSGDSPARVATVARALGVAPEHVAARESPEDKLAAVASLRAAGHRVLMVGDGVNDAPVLAAADVSIALGATAADLPKLAADAVLMSPSLATVVFAIKQARRVSAISRQNFAWAIAYNVIAVPLAVANLVTPATAAIGMAVSSLIVVANSLRLARSD